MPLLLLQPSEGSVGTEVTATGTGFRPNVGYRIQLENQWVKPGTTKNRGSFITKFRIPPMPYGDQDVIAISQAAHQLAHATFQVRPQITQVEPAEVLVGETITVSGTGLGRDEPIEVRIDNRPVELGEEVRTNPDGTFTVRVTVAEDLVPPTPVIITVIGKETGTSAQTQQKLEVKLVS